MHQTTTIWTGIGTLVFLGAGFAYVPQAAEPEVQSKAMEYRLSEKAAEVLLAQKSDQGTVIALNTEEMDNVEMGKAVVEDFVNAVIVPTYEQLNEDASTMAAAIIAFTNQPTEATLTEAREAWVAARAPWEQSEAFAFGPAASLGYDADLDDWPVNEADVITILNGDDPLTLETVQGLQTTQKGAHTIEFLLFGLNNDKALSDFTDRELDYLGALALAFEETAQNLLTSWVDGIEGNPPYQEVLVTAGSEDNPAYLTVRSAVVELVAGMIGLLDEVANVKIGDPLNTQDPFGFESRFSQTSLEDFRNNLLSAQTVYLTEAPNFGGSSDSSLSEYAASLDPELDQQIKAEIQAAIAAIEAVPAPIETRLSDPEAFAQLSKAQIAVLKVLETIEDELLPLVQS